MRSPSPKSLRDLPLTIDNDQTLINRNDDNDDEWTDDEPVNGDDNDVYFHWDEEDTLFSDLLEEAYGSETKLFRHYLNSRSSALPRLEMPTLSSWRNHSKNPLMMNLVNSRRRSPGLSYPL